MVNSEKEERLFRGRTRKERGPWLVRRATKKGMASSLRFPSEIEREKNKTRERTRRKITSKIYAGLRAFGGYELPKNADNNLLLIALCEEAGWHVDQDGTISRKDLDASGDGTRDEMNKCGVMGDDNVNLTLSL